MNSISLSLPAFAQESRTTTEWDEGGSWNRSYGLNVSAQPRESLEIRFGPNLRQSYNEAQFVTSVEDPLATGTYGRRYVFAGLDRTTLSFDTRVNVTFTPHLSLQLYAEPFISIGDYGQLREFAEPGTYAFLDYGEEVGSVSRVDERTYRIDPDGTGAAASGDHGWVGDFDLSRDTRGMFGTAPDNIFVIEVDYWLNP